MKTHERLENMALEPRHASESRDCISNYVIVIYEMWHLPRGDFQLPRQDNKDPPTKVVLAPIEL